MKILLTNDDGYRADGLWALARELAKENEVIICAPDRQRSAISHAITLHKPLRLRHAEKRDEPNIRVYHTNGTPSDAAMLGMLELAKDADLAISGINGGPNMGEDVMYSGTVAGAVEAALMGAPALAVSLSEYENPNYELAAAFTAAFAPMFVNAGLPRNTVLNINAPPGTAKDYRGFEITPLGTRSYDDVLQKRVDPRGEAYYWVTGQLQRDVTTSPSDFHTISKGMISITPITLRPTDHEALAKMRFDDPMGR